MSAALGFIKRFLKYRNPPECSPTAESRPLKFGVVGAAAIAPAAIIGPAKSHPETVLYAVAARDKARATAFAKRHGFAKAYGGPNGYQGNAAHFNELRLPIFASFGQNSSTILKLTRYTFLYVATRLSCLAGCSHCEKLPNGLHYEWTMKALIAGKHVLLEKPSANTAEETRQMFDLAEKKGLVLLEAFHYRFHPAVQRVKAIIDSKELGAVKNISAALALTSGIIKAVDIRFDFALGGGSLMDTGCYTLNVIRYLSSSNPTSVISTEHTLYKSISPPASVPNIDRAAAVTLALPNDVTASLKTDLRVPFKYGVIPTLPELNVVITLEGGEIELYNYVMPTLYHSITVKTKSGGKLATRVEKAYTFKEGKMEGKGEAWWTTYRFQLEAFVDRIKGRTPQTWLDKEDSIANMHWIEQIYAKTGLGSRPKSDYVLPQS
ncbi:hypothetical protein H0H87_006372 [Tephrocybe sp. NHM501043]|nr:hypothetical protein H0H87_006372 [Tephrocybe sp. NHM501043]